MIFSLQILIGAVRYLSSNCNVFTVVLWMVVGKKVLVGAYFQNKVYIFLGGIL